MEGARKLRVVVADDHEPLRRGVVEMLSTDPAIEVVAEAADGAESVEATARLHPDVLVLDIAMPRLDGVEAARRIAARAPEVGILVLTALPDEDAVVEMVKAGARGYLLKTAASELAAAVRAVGAGNPYYGQHALDVLVGRFGGRRRRKRAGMRRTPSRK
jgi:DNA-binding NarL/FixJ family response regulator